MSADPVAIGRSALDVEWQRLQVIAQNLANLNTSRVPGGGPYRPIRIVTGPNGGFGTLLDSGSAVGDSTGVRVVSVEMQPLQVRRVHDPDHPDADQDGFVSYPDISHAAQMAELARTARIYETNLTAMSLARQMNMRALELGRR